MLQISVPRLWSIYRMPRGYHCSYLRPFLAGGVLAWAAIRNHGVLIQC